MIFLKIDFEIVCITRLRNSFWEIIYFLSCIPVGLNNDIFSYRNVSINTGEILINIKKLSNTEQVISSLQWNISFK
jgi:hypothetical protein